ncbi:MAG TPA: cyclase family protein [Tepidisphaeraceae bacterium]|nr:cyclase family protein [Tepidisphaeraceae bacterium]
MELIDLSQPLFDGAPNCPAHPPVRIHLEATHEQHGWQLEMLTLASHTGSHIDAPLHKLAGGASIDQIPLERFVGPAVIVDCRDVGADGAIDASLLEARTTLPLKNMIVLLNTGWGESRRMDDNWKFHSPFLSIDGAQWLIAQRINGVGIDHYSIAGSREPNNARVHEILLGGGAWIVEELHFPVEAMQAAQPAMMWCLPINLKGHSGAFCRPVLAVVS